jgi:pimeloyl-ACP methyl ester carboxylesterase
MTATAVLVHGGWAGPWIWRDVISLLDERGVPNVAVHLPSVTSPGPGVGFDTDAAHVREAVDGPVVLVGNSYGGLVITEAAVDNPQVKRLVYLAAFMPGVEDKIPDFLIEASDPEFASLIKFRDDGLTEIDVDGCVARAFTQAPPHMVEAAGSELGVPMSLTGGNATAVSGSSWATTPSTYVVCTEDLAIKPDVQREWAKTRATDYVEWASDHCPQCSHPDLVADLVERIVADA